MGSQPTTFEFSSYTFEPEQQRVSFSYRSHFAKGASLDFTETLLLPSELPLAEVPEALLERLLQSLHLMLGISYYKLYCPARLEVPYALSEQQAEFFTTVYRRGLGEFWYRNDLDPSQSPAFPATTKAHLKPFEHTLADRILIGIGGGKDSIVATELLREAGHEISGFVVETHHSSGLIEAVVQSLGLEALKVRRELDPQLLHKLPGSLSGHIPVSAIYALIGELLAVLYDFRYLAVANEQSSNFGNLEYQGETINHQWSKSAEFEQLLQDYTRNILTPDLTYFSALRPFSELRITELFTRYPKYFKYFSSCNRNFKINRDDVSEAGPVRRPGPKGTGDSAKAESVSNGAWCGQCPKCAFTFAMLAAWLPPDTLVKIFGANLFNEATLLPTFKDLLGLGTLKPFDCVGTFEETQAAFYLARESYSDTTAIKTLLPQLQQPERVVSSAKQTHPSPTLPARFAFTGMGSVLILGAGKEGTISARYLAQYQPKLVVSTADQQDDPAYLAKQSEFDIAIKTPGLAKEKVTIHYTTATNLFLAQVSNSTIGVTGTKGKSTCASLIQAMLAAGGKQSQLLGNIGQPMLGALLTDVDPETIFVLELSSFQLDDIQFSPTIAVALNLWSDHLDYHGSMAAYSAAKKHIVDYQRPSDFFVYNPADEQLQTWLPDLISQPLPFIDTLPLPDSALPLLGQHNKDNVRAAVTVAKHLGISDEHIASAITAFSPLPHRLQKIGEFKGITFYDDAISTTPESTMAAIEALPNIGTIMLGGLDRGYDFTALEELIHDRRIPTIVLFPDTGDRILQDRTGLEVLQTEKMEEAVRFAFKHTPLGSVCLLSTASPSYSLWENFEEQGDDFQNWVKKLAEG